MAAAEALAAQQFPEHVRSEYTSGRRQVMSRRTTHIGAAEQSVAENTTVALFLQALTEFDEHPTDVVEALSRESGAASAAKKDASAGAPAHAQGDQAGEPVAKQAQDQAVQQKTSNAMRTQLRPFTVLGEIIRTDPAVFAARTWQGYPVESDPGNVEATRAAQSSGAWQFLTGFVAGAQRLHAFLDPGANTPLRVRGARCVVLREYVRSFFSQFR